MSTAPSALWQWLHTRWWQQPPFEQVWLPAAAACSLGLLSAVPFIMAAASAGTAGRENTVAVDSDLSVYAASVVGADSEADLSRDFVFGQTGVRWSASPVYLWTFHHLYRLAGRDLDAALQFFAALLVLVYVPPMVVWLDRLGLPFLLACAGAVLSSRVASFSITGTRWGLDAHVVPLMATTALTPALALSVAWLLQRANTWRGAGRYGAVVAAGLVCSFPLWALNPVSGLALIQSCLVAALAAWRCGAVPGGTAGLLMTSCVAIVLAKGLVSPGPTVVPTWNEAVEIVRFGQEWAMVFPFGSLRRQLASGQGAWLPSALLVTFLLQAAAAIAAWLDLGVARSDTSWRRLGWTVFVCFVAFQVMLLMNSGWLVLVPLAATLLQLRSRRLSELDRALWAISSACLCLGPVQQLLALGVWGQGHLAGLTGFVFESARLVQFSALFFYSMVARSVWDLVRSVRGRTFRAIAALALLGAWALSANVNPWPRGDFSFSEGLCFVLAAAFVTKPYWQSWFPPPDRDTYLRLVLAIASALPVFAVAVVAFGRWGLEPLGVALRLAATVALCTSGFAMARTGWRSFGVALLLAGVGGGSLFVGLLQEPVRNRAGGEIETLAFATRLNAQARGAAGLVGPCSTKVLSPEYLATVDFVRENLPRNALLLVGNGDPSFRSRARRATLPVRTEWLLATYAQGNALAVRERSTRAAGTPPAELPIEAARQGAEYVVTCGERPTRLPTLFTSGAWAVTRAASVAVGK